MQTISTTDARSDFSGVISAAQFEPIMIQRQNKDVAVVISPAEYNKLRGIKVAELRALIGRVGARAKKDGLTEKKLAQLLGEKR